MKKFQRIAVLVLSACLAFGMMTVSAFGYDYQLEVSAGNGSFSSGDTLKGTTASIDIDNAKLTVGEKTVDITAPDKNHFVIGMKVTGHDNSEVFTDSVKLADYNEDVSLVVAYGLKSNMVKYTIRYVEVDGGANVHEPEDHYGVVGQKPVVSYKYAEGYLPDAYNRTGTLERDKENVFTFYYYKVDANGQVINVQDGTNVVAGGNAAGNAAGGNAAGNAGANAGVNIGDGAVPLANAPADSVDIDDNGTPLAANPDEEEGGGPGAFPFIIGGVIAAAIIAAIAAVLARRKGEDVE